MFTNPIKFIPNRSCHDLQNSILEVSGLGIGPLKPQNFNQLTLVWESASSSFVKY